ncbi:hypothetical protein [Thalassoglobus neptunius]|nr:hypothetical protein [Thalassoglobus neptunius]
MKLKLFGFLFAILSMCGPAHAANLYTDSFDTTVRYLIDAWDVTVPAGNYYWNSGVDTTPWVNLHPSGDGFGMDVHQGVQKLRGLDANGEAIIDMNTSNLEIEFTSRFQYSSSEVLVWIRSNSDRTDAIGVYFDQVDDEFYLVDETKTAIAGQDVVSLTIDTTSTYTIRITVDSNDEIKVYVDDDLKKTYSDSTANTGTYIGFALPGVNSLIDDLVVDEFDATPTYEYGVASVTTSTDIEVSLPRTLLDAPVVSGQYTFVAWAQIDDVAGDGPQAIATEDGTLGGSTKVILGVEADGNTYGHAGHTTSSIWTNSQVAVDDTWHMFYRSGMDVGEVGRTWSAMDDSGNISQGTPQTTTPTGRIKFGGFNGKLAAIAVYDTYHSATTSEFYDGGSGGVGKGLDTYAEPIAIFLFDTASGQLVDPMGNATIHTATGYTVLDEEPPFEQPAFSKDIKVSIYGVEVANGGTITVPSTVPLGSNPDMPVKIESDVSNSTMGLTVSNIEVTGDLAWDRSSAFSSDSMANGGHGIYRFRLTPNSEGARSGTVTITSDSDEDATYSFDVDFTVADVTGVSEPTLDMTGASTQTLPTFEARTAKRPTCRWVGSEFCQVVKDDEDYWAGVACYAHGGIRQVEFMLRDKSSGNGNTVTVTTPTVRTVGVNADGTTRYQLAYWCEIPASLPAGVYDVAATVTANDPNFQTLSSVAINGVDLTSDPWWEPIHLHKLSSTPTTYYVDGDVVSSGDGSSGSPFKTIDEGFTACGVNGGIVKLMAGTQIFDTGGAAVENTAGILLELDDGVTNDDITYTTDGSNYPETTGPYADFDVWRLQIKGLRFDYKIAIPGRGGLCYHTFTECEFYHSDGLFPIGSDGQPLQASIQLSPFTYGTELCYWHEVYDGIIAANSTHDSMLESVRDGAATRQMIGTRVQACQPDLYITGYESIQIQYTGGDATASVEKFGSGGASGYTDQDSDPMVEDWQPDGGIILKSSGSADLTLVFLRGTPDSKPAEGYDEAITIDEVVDWVNDQTDWTATATYAANKPADLGGYLGARFVTAENASGSGAFTWADAKTSPISVWTRFDAHCDAMAQWFAHVDGSVSTAPQYNYMMLDCVYQHNLPNGSTNTSDLQHLLIQGIAGGLYDSCMVNNAWLNLPNASQAGAFNLDTHNFNYVGNTCVGGQRVYWKYTLADSTSDDVWMANVWQAFDPASEDSGGDIVKNGERYLAFNIQEDGDFESGLFAATNYTTADLKIGSDGMPASDSPALEKLPAGLVYRTHRPRPDGSGYDEFLRDGTDAIGAFEYSSGSNTAPSLDFTQSLTEISENASTASRIEVGTITIFDDGEGTNTLSLTGTDASMFEIESNTLYISADETLDYDSNPSLTVTINVDDSSVGSTPDDTYDVTVTVLEYVNTAPTIEFAQAVGTVSEGMEFDTRFYIGAVTITDDGEGTNTLSLTGDDADDFELVGNDLYIRAETSLDFDTNPVLNVTINVDDSSVGSTPDDTVDVTVNVLAVNPDGRRLRNLLLRFGAIDWDSLRKRKEIAHEKREYVLAP